MADFSKVFWLPECEERMHTEATLFHSLQQLLYIPFVWGQEDKDQWRALPYAGDVPVTSGSLNH